MAFDGVETGIDDRLSRTGGTNNLQVPSANFYPVRGFFFMITIIESFACGLAFAMGVTSWFFIQQFLTAKARAELREEMLKHGKIVEDRLAAQVSTMVTILEAINETKAKDRK